jgi:hypothetical protein
MVGFPLDMTRSKTTNRRQFLSTAAATAVMMPASLSKGFAVFSHSRFLAETPAARGAAASVVPEGAIEFESSDDKLADGFRWAKAQALAYARNDGSIGPWYEAALPGRDAFCMRDVSHQSTGAQFLGLGSRTLNMLRRFAANISASKKWCTWWEITHDNLPAAIDYNNDHDFWYDLPASFDVLDACYRQWLWTRDSNYLDEVFLDYYRHTVTDYVQAWDHDRDGLLEHLPNFGHMGIATYDEDLQDEILVGSDLIAAQYAAFRDYAAIERTRNESTVAAEFDRKADGLQSLYNSRWWDAGRNRYFDALGESGKFTEGLKESTGRSTIEFPLYYGLTEKGFKTVAVLDELEKRLKLDEDAIHGVVGGVEGRSYLPDIFYKYGRSRAGYRALTAMMDPGLKRREYPEVSYTVIGNLGAGLMGIRPLDREQTVETFPQLTDETGWAALHHVPVGRNVISVKHVKNNETSLTNENGPALAWCAAFPGKFRALFSSGKEIPATITLRREGDAETYSTVQVARGETRVARVVPG